MSKAGIVLYEEQFDGFKLLSMEDRGLLITAIFEYRISGSIIDLPSNVNMAFQFIKMRLDKDRIKYSEKCKTNKKNGEKGGRPTENRTVISKTENNRTVFEETENNRTVFEEKEKEEETTKENKEEKSIKKEESKERKKEELKEKEGFSRSSPLQVDDEHGDEGQKNEEETHLLEQRFDIFWQAYPRKQDKVTAKRRWRALKPSEELFQTIMTAIERQKKSKQWIKDQGQYIPMPSTWLHQKRWNDKLEIEVNSQAGKPTVRYSNFDPEDAMVKAISRSVSIYDSG